MIKRISIFLTIILIILLYPINSHSIELEASWDASLSALTEKIIYKIYFKNINNRIEFYEVDANSTCYTFEYNPKEGQKEIWVTAIDLIGLESDSSNSLIIKTPKCPKDLSIKKQNL